MGGVPAPAAAGPAPSAAAASPAARRPCCAALSGLPAAAPSGRSTGLSSSPTAALSQPETPGYLEVGEQKQPEHPATRVTTPLIAYDASLICFYTF